MAKQWAGRKVTVTPVVLGDLGVVAGLRKQLMKSGVFNKDQAEALATTAQRETVTFTARIIRHHLAL